MKDKYNYKTLTLLSPNPLQGEGRSKKDINKQQVSAPEPTATNMSNRASTYKTYSEAKRFAKRYFADLLSINLKSVNVKDDEYNESRYSGNGVQCECGQTACYFFNMSNAGTRQQETLDKAGQSSLCVGVCEHCGESIGRNWSKKKVAEYIEQQKESAAYNERMSAIINEEAASIVIDEQFKAALLYASEATGKEKSNRMASAMKGLLERNNTAEIKSDFWKVFRILKAKAEQHN